jgi:hypothetical protein
VGFSPIPDSNAAKAGIVFISFLLRVSHKQHIIMLSKAKHFYLLNF